LIVVDTSALIAVVRREPEQIEFTRLLRDAVEPKLSAATLAETFIVLAGRSRDDNSGPLLEFLDRTGVDIVGVDRRQVLLVNDAFLRFGKGRHKASLNYGDCFAYALAKSLGVPLLFKGDDFRHTDIRPAL
jgi:ribonuclease VapC